MFKLYIQALFLGHTCHVHQTGAIRACHIFSTRLDVSFHLVLTHLGTDRCFFYREHATKAAAFVRTLRFHDLNAIYGDGSISANADNNDETEPDDQLTDEYMELTGGTGTLFPEGYIGEKATERLG